MILIQGIVESKLLLMKSKRIQLIATLMLWSSLIQIPQANAWETGTFTPDAGGKGFIAQTYFQLSVGTSHYKQPTGARQTLSVICVNGVFSIAFSAVSAQETQISIGSAKVVEVKIPATGKSVNYSVNTKKGMEFVAVTKPKELYLRMKTRQDMYVKMFANGQRAYEARFKTTELTKYSKDFLAAGCKL
jgi:hypothetical protein